MSLNSKSISLESTRPLANRPSANKAARQSALGQTDSSLRILPYIKVHGTPTRSVEPQHLNYSIWGDKSKSFSKGLFLNGTIFIQRDPPKIRRNSSKDFPTPDYLSWEFILVSFNKDLKAANSFFPLAA